MKKLMKTVAAAAVALLGFGAFADLPSPSATFEGLSTGDKTVSALVTNDDAGSSEGAKYWFAVTNDSQALDAVIGVVTNETGRGNYFAMETSAPLYRTINSTTSQYGSDFNNAAEAETIGSDGIYLDTMVKFTPSEELFKDGDLEASVDKLAISYVENDEGITGIVVRAGYVSGSTVTPTNYIMSLPSGVNVADWQRLTVRAIADVGSSTAPVGFAVYLHETLLTYGTNVAAGDSTYTGALNPAVTQNLYNSETHALLPSLVTTGDYKSTLTAVGFKGTGSLDNIQFTDEKPDFIVEEVVATFTADAGVTAISVQVGEDDPIAVDMTADTLAASLPAGTTEFTVTATIDSTYTFSRMTYGNGVFNANPATITGYAGGAIAISTTRNNFNLFDANNVAISGTFETLAQAMAATGVAKIQLAYDYTVAAADIPDGYIDIQQSITIDLNGKTINGGESVSNPLFMVTDGNFVIIDSAGNGKVVYNGPGIVFGASAYIGAASDDFGPTFDGKLFLDGGEGYVIRGKFNAASNGTSVFLYADDLGDGDSIESTCSATPVDGYWVVAPSAQPEPTKIAVPTAESNLVYDGEEQTGVAAGEGYTLTGTAAATDAGEYTATATLKDGYIWSDDSTEAKDINWSIAADTSATVVVTLTDYEEEYTAQLAFPTASATIGGNAVAGTSVWNPDTITEPSAAGVTNTYEVTFTVTGGNYAGSTGTATFKVYKAAGGEYPTYIDPSDTETKAKYDTWKETYGADTGSAYEDAFLLNCAPADVETAKANFKATITVNADGTVTVTAPGDYNVTPTIQGKQTLSNTEEWHTKTDGDKFFRAVLSL